MWMKFSLLIFQCYKIKQCVLYTGGSNNVLDKITKWKIVNLLQEAVHHDQGESQEVPILQTTEETVDLKEWWFPSNHEDKCCFNMKCLPKTCVWILGL